MSARVLMFGWEFPPYMSGGLGTACFGLTRAMAERGDDIIFVMPKRLNVSSPWVRFRFPEKEGALSVRAINSPLSAYVTSTAYAQLRKGWQSEAASSLYSSDLINEVRRYADLGGVIASEESFDIIYAHDWLSMGAGVEAKRVTGKPLIVHIHATEFDRCGGGEGGVNQDVYNMEKAGFEAADAIVAVSNFTKDVVVRRYGIAPEKIWVVYNGIDDETVPRGTGESRLLALKDAGYKLVLFLGRITLQKGPDYFVRMARKVLDYNPNVIFVITGSGDMEYQLMNLVGELGIADKVFFTGFLSGAERFEVYAAADLYVMPSVSEPFGITPLEAIKLGKPVLVSKQSGVSEVVKHALKADFWDIDEMANQVLSVVGFPGLGETLSSNAIQEANRLTWTAAAERVDNVIRSVLHGVQ